MSHDTLASLDAFLDSPISFQQLTLILLDLPQKEVFHSGIGVRKSRKALIVKWTDQDGAVGYGECSCRPDPYYSDEFLDAALLLIRQFIVPFLPECTSYREVLALLGKLRGWPFTKAAVEFALHDLIERKSGKNIFQYWERTHRDKVPVGISMGIQASWEALNASVVRAQAQGYRRLKFKISPQTEAAHFIQLQTQLAGAYVSFDANGTFYAADLDRLKVFTDFRTMIEQPFPPGRIDIYLAAKKRFPHLFVCLDEEIKHIGALIMAHQLGAIDELNLKPGRVGGLYNSIQIVEYCLRHDIPCWIGGMFETGIGRSLNLRIAARLAQAAAHDLSPSSRYFEEDVLVHPIDMDENGFISLSQVRNEVDEAMLKKYAVKWEVLGES